MKRKPLIVEQSFVDIHSHLLPGLDDGAASLEESLELARCAIQNGVDIVISTPHFYTERNPLKRGEYLKLIGEFQSALEENNLALTVLPGAEVRASYDILDYLESDFVMTLNDTGQYLLLEFPHGAIPSFAQELIFQLRLRGITPILSHPETNRAIQKDVSLLQRLVEMGSLVQLRASSFAGGEHPRTPSFVRKLLKMNLVDVIGSDAHFLPGRKCNLQNAYRELVHFAGQPRAEEIALTNPKKIICGQPLS